MPHISGKRGYTFFYFDSILFLLIDFRYSLFPLLLDFHLREGLEVFQAGIAPLLGILQLNIEEGISMLPFLFMSRHILLGRSVPVVTVNFYHRYAHIVSHAKFLPEGAARLHPVIPCHMMEPEKILLRTGLEVVVLAAIRLRLSLF